MIAFWTRKANFKWTRLVCGVLLFSILWSIAAAPYAAASLWSDRKLALNQMRRQQVRQADSPAAAPPTLTQGWSLDGLEAQNARDGLNIPEKFGSILEVWKPTAAFQNRDGQSPLVIHIQDAHGYAEAQKNSARILESILSANAQKRLPLCVEGAWDAVNTDWLKVFPDPAGNAAFVQGLLEQGLLNGEEYLSLTGGADRLDIRGVEDEETYKANLEARNLVNPGRERILNRLALMDDRLQRLQAQIYPAELRELDLASRKFEAQDLPVQKYYSRLIRILPARPGDYPNLDAFGRLMALGERVSIAKIRDEVGALVGSLGNDEERRPLAQLASAYRAGEINNLNYYQYLKKLADLRRIATPDIRLYVDYLQELQRLDQQALQDELADLEGKCYHRLAGGRKDILELIQAFRALRMQHRFWNSEFTPRDWDEYQNHKRSGDARQGIDETDLKSIAGEIREKEKTLRGGHAFEPSREAAPRLADTGALSPGRSLPHRIDFSGQVEKTSQNLPTFTELKFLQESYYKLAFKRNSILVENTLAQLEKSPRNRAVLIAGGFHTPGILAELRKRNIPYVVVRPQFGPQTVERNGPENKAEDERGDGFSYRALLGLYVDRLKDLKKEESKKRGPDADRLARGIDGLIDALQNRLVLAGPFTDDQNRPYVLGTYSGPQSKTTFLIQFSNSESAIPRLAYADFSDRLRLAMGTLREQEGTQITNRSLPLSLLTLRLGSWFAGRGNFRIGGIFSDRQQILNLLARLRAPRGLSQSALAGLVGTMPRSPPAAALAVPAATTLAPGSAAPASLTPAPAQSPSRMAAFWRQASQFLSWRSALIAVSAVALMIAATHLGWHHAAAVPAATSLAFFRLGRGSKGGSGNAAPQITPNQTARVADALAVADSPDLQKIDIETASQLSLWDVILAKAGDRNSVITAKDLDSICKIIDRVMSLNQIDETFAAGGIGKYAYVSNAIIVRANMTIDWLTRRADSLKNDKLLQAETAETLLKAYNAVRINQQIFWAMNGAQNVILMGGYLFPRGLELVGLLALIPLGGAIWLSVNLFQMFPAHPFWILPWAAIALLNFILMQITVGGRNKNKGAPPHKRRLLRFSVFSLAIMSTAPLWRFLYGISVARSISKRGFKNGFNTRPDGAIELSKRYFDLYHGSEYQDLPNKLLEALTHPTIFYSDAPVNVGLNYTWGLRKLFTRAAPLMLNVIIPLTPVLLTMGATFFFTGQFVIPPGLHQWWSSNFIKGTYGEFTILLSFGFSVVASILFLLGGGLNQWFNSRVRGRISRNRSRGKIERFLKQVGLANGRGGIKSDARQEQIEDNLAVIRAEEQTRKILTTFDEQMQAQSPPFDLMMVIHNSEQPLGANGPAARMRDRLRREALGVPLPPGVPVLVNNRRTGPGSFNALGLAIEYFQDHLDELKAQYPKQLAHVKSPADLRVLIVVVNADSEGELDRLLKPIPGMTLHGQGVSSFLWSVIKGTYYFASELDKKNVHGQPYRGFAVRVPKPGSITISEPGGNGTFLTLLAQRMSADQISALGRDPEWFKWVEGILFTRPDFLDTAMGAYLLRNPEDVRALILDFKEHYGEFAGHLEEINPVLKQILLSFGETNFTFVNPEVDYLYFLFLYYMSKLRLQRGDGKQLGQLAAENPYEFIADFMVPIFRALRVMDETIFGNADAAGNVNEKTLEFLYDIWRDRGAIPLTNPAALNDWLFRRILDPHAKVKDLPGHNIEAIRQLTAACNAKFSQFAAIRLAAFGDDPDSIAQRKLQEGYYQLFYEFLIPVLVRLQVTNTAVLISGQPDLEPIFLEIQRFGSVHAWLSAQRSPQRRSWWRRLPNLLSSALLVLRGQATTKPDPFLPLWTIIGKVREGNRQVKIDAPHPSFRTEILLDPNSQNSPLRQAVSRVFRDWQGTGGGPSSHSVELRQKAARIAQTAVLNDGNDYFKQAMIEAGLSVTDYSQFANDLLFIQDLPGGTDGRLLSEDAVADGTNSLLRQVYLYLHLRLKALPLEYKEPAPELEDQPGPLGVPKIALSRMGSVPAMALLRKSMRSYLQALIYACVQLRENGGIDAMRAADRAQPRSLPGLIVRLYDLFDPTHPDMRLNPAQFDKYLDQLLFYIFSVDDRGPRSLASLQHDQAEVLAMKKELVLALADPDAPPRPTASWFENPVYVRWFSWWLEGLGLLYILHLVSPIPLLVPVAFPLVFQYLHWLAPRTLNLLHGFLPSVFPKTYPDKHLDPAVVKMTGWTAGAGAVAFAAQYLAQITGNQSFMIATVAALLVLTLKHLQTNTGALSALSERALRMGRIRHVSQMVGDPLPATDLRAEALFDDAETPLARGVFGTLGAPDAAEPAGARKLHVLDLRDNIKLDVSGSLQITQNFLDAKAGIRRYLQKTGSEAAEFAIVLNVRDLGEAVAGMNADQQKRILLQIEQALELPRPVALAAESPQDLIAQLKTDNRFADFVYTFDPGAWSEGADEIVRKVIDLAEILRLSGEFQPLGARLQQTWTALTVIDMQQ